MEFGPVCNIFMLTIVFKNFSNLIASIQSILLRCSHNQGKMARDAGIGKHPRCTFPIVFVGPLISFRSK